MKNTIGFLIILLLLGACSLTGNNNEEVLDEKVDNGQDFAVDISAVETSEDDI